MNKPRPGTRMAKDALFDALAGVGRALASGRRVEILELLAQGERSVEEVAVEVGQSVANASHHLRSLATAGLVRTRRDGQRIYYRLASEGVLELRGVLQRVAADHLAEVERLAETYLGDRQGTETVSRAELLERLRRGEVTVIDVRPVSEYESGHIPGARSVPPELIRRALRALPSGAEVVAYCRGRYCVFADEAIRFLEDRGVRAERLEDGFPEWRQAGLPVAAGSGAGGIA